MDRWVWIIAWVVIALIAVTGVLPIFRGNLSIFAFAGPWERWEKGEVEGNEVGSAILGVMGRRGLRYGNNFLQIGERSDDEGRLLLWNPSH